MTCIGSPPRMRGISKYLSQIKEFDRFTPAYAGNIRMQDRPRLLPQVHPRVCGEYFPLFIRLSSILGSPPRMRGISCQPLWRTSKERFTPAYAGNIKKFLELILTMKVHPRVCGEYICVQSLFAGFVGSPPRMRGIWCASWLLNYIRRFTPAYAGNIFCWQARLPFGKVHPRVCGEYTKKIMK